MNTPLTSRVRSRHVAYSVVVGGVVAFQLLVTRGLEGPFIYADELGYVAAARYFGGVGHPTMLSAFYHGGMGLLWAPLTLLTSEPAPFHRLAVITQIVATGGGMLATARGLRALAFSDRAAIWGSLAFGVALPALISPSILWAETSLIVLTAVTLRVLVAPVGNPINDAVIVLGSAVAAYAIHPRGATLALATAVAFATDARRATMARSVMLTGTVAGIAGVRLMNERLAAAVYAQEATVISESDLASRIIARPDRWLTGLTGMAWYQIIASGALVALGLLVGVSWLRGSAQTNRARQTAARFLVLAFLGAWAVGAFIALDDEPRTDQLYYGRYLDHLAPALIALGVAALVQHPRRWWRPWLIVGGSAAFLGAALRMIHGATAFDERRFVALNSPGVAALEQALTTRDPLILGAVVGGIIAGAAVLSRRRPVLVVAALIACSLIGGHAVLRESVLPPSKASSSRAPLADVVERVAPFDERPSILLAAPYDYFALYALQYWADDADFALSTECRTTPHDAVIAEPDHSRYRHYVLIGADPVSGYELRFDPTGYSTTSRSAAVEGRMPNSIAPDSTIQLDLVVTNLDSERRLELQPLDEVARNPVGIVGLALALVEPETPDPYPPSATVVGLAFDQFAVDPGGSTSIAVTVSLPADVASGSYEARLGVYEARGGFLSACTTSDDDLLGSVSIGN